MVVRFDARVLGIPLEEVAAIGDMPSDVLMFGVAARGIAMGNASPEVQRTARYVTTSNEEEGFARAVEAFVLGGGPRSPRAALGLPDRTRACLFDLDGVLTRTSGLHAAAWKQTFDAFLRERAAAAGETPFIPFDAVHDYASYVDGKLRLDGARTFLASRGIELPDETVRGLAERKDEILLEVLAEQKVETYDGSLSYLRARARGRPAHGGRVLEQAHRPGAGLRRDRRPVRRAHRRRRCRAGAPRRQAGARHLPGGRAHAGRLPPTRRSCSRMRSPVSRPAGRATSATWSASTAWARPPSFAGTAPTWWCPTSPRCWRPS